MNKFDRPTRILMILSALTFGSEAARAATPAKLPHGMFSTAGNQVVDETHTPIRLACVYWTGMNDDDGQLADVNWPINGIQANVNAIAITGFNCIRVDINNMSLHDRGSASYLFQLDQLVAAAAKADLRVIINDHDNEGRMGTKANQDCDAQQANGIWYDLGGASNGTDGCGNLGHTTQSSFLEDWVSIASRYAGNNTVIGYDLWNEPLSYGDSTWGDQTDHDIHQMYQAVGSALLALDPSKLIFAECPQNYAKNALFDGVTLGPAPWGDCTGVKNNPVVFTIKGSVIRNKVVYDVHLYPNSISSIAPLFSGSSSSASAVKAMNASFGFLVSKNAAAVWVGESGTGLAQYSDDLNWANMLDDYLNGYLGAQGGPTFTGHQKGMGIAWMSWNLSFGSSQDNLGIILNSYGPANAYEPANVRQVAILESLFYYPY